MEQETSWTAVIALVLSLMAIIFIIVLIYLFSVNSDVITSRIDDWAIRESGTSGTAATPEVFVGTPNTILNINPGIPAGYTVQITSYPALPAVIAAGRTTLFKIVNTRAGPAQPVAVTLPTGITFAPTGTGVPNPAVVAPGTTATYMWLSTTVIQRIS